MATVTKMWCSVGRMRPFLLCTAGLAVLATTGLGGQATFRSGVDAVAVYGVVTGRDGRPVDNLNQDDFRIEDQGQPVPITLFSRERQPLSVALLLDTSDSTLSKVFRIRDAARAFVHALEPDDRVRIGTFGEEIAISRAATGDRAVLDRVLLEELWPGGATPLWNALDAGMSAVARETGRRVVIAVTDGDNNASLPGYDGTLDAVRRRAVGEDFLLYGIGMEGAALSRPMVDLTVASGGAHFDVKRDADLDATFASVAEELRHQYLLGFVPAARDGKVHALEVRVTKPGLKVRSRRSYVPTIDASAARPEPPEPAAAAAPPAPSRTSPGGRSIAIVIDATIGNKTAADVSAWLSTRAPGTDQLMIGLMTRDMKWSAWSAEPAALRAWLDTAQQPRDFSESRYGPSPIWDAAGAAVDSMKDTAGPREVILITDGRGSGNLLASTDVAQRARAAGVRVSTIVTLRAEPLSLGGRMAIVLHPEYQPKAVATATRGTYAERIDGQITESLALTLERILSAVR